MGFIQTLMIGQSTFKANTIFNSKLRKLGYFERSPLDKNGYKVDTRSSILFGCSTISGFYVLPCTMSLGRNFKLCCQVPLISILISPLQSKACLSFEIYSHMSSTFKSGLWGPSWNYYSIIFQIQILF